MVNTLLLVLVAVLASCADETTATTECGDAPLAPGWAAAFEGDTVTMSRADYENILAWRDDVSQWTTCVGGDL